MEALPYGTYEVCFTAASGLYRGATQTLTIAAPRDSAAISVLPEDRSAWGSLEIRVRRANGESFDGRLTVRLTAGERGRTTTANAPFEGSPYILPMLPPQKVKVLAIPSVPRNAELPESLTGEVEVVRGEKATLDLAMSKF